MGKMSRRKGANFENTVAKQFTEWLGYNVRRTPRSGAYGGEGWKDMSSDLMFDFDFPYVVECKNRESWKMEHVYAGKGEVWDWWAKLILESISAKKQPMLILKKNHMEPLVMLPKYDALVSELRGGGHYTALMIGHVALVPLERVLLCDPPGGRRIDHATEGSLPWGG
jgi:Holliday junction resolvase